jgi:hypothetical protein
MAKAAKKKVAKSKRGGKRWSKRVTETSMRST